MTLDDRELDRRLNALTRETNADESLWPGIEQRLRPARRWPAITGSAAAVTAGAIVIALSVFDSAPPERPDTAQSQAEAMRAAAPDALAVSSIYGSQSLMKAWQENQAAIEQLEQALARDPDNRLLLEFLSEARLRQARLIQRGAFPPERSI